MPASLVDVVGFHLVVWPKIGLLGFYDVSDVIFDIFSLCSALGFV